MNAKRKNFSENRHFEKEEGSSPRKKKEKKTLLVERLQKKKIFQHHFELNYIRETIKVSEYFI